MSSTLWIVHIDGPKADAFFNGAVGPIEAGSPSGAVEYVTHRHRLKSEEILRVCPVFEEDLWALKDDYWVPERSRNRVPSLEALAFVAGLLGYRVERLRSSRLKTAGVLYDPPKVVDLEKVRLEDDGTAFEFEITSDLEIEKPVLVGEGGRNEEAVEHVSPRLSSALRSLFISVWKKPAGPPRVDLYQDDEGRYWVRCRDRVTRAGDRYFVGLGALISLWNGEWSIESAAEPEHIMSFDDWLAEQSREDASEPVAFFDGPTENRPFRQELHDVICEHLPVGTGPDHFDAIAGEATGLGAEWFRKRFEGEEEMSYDDVRLVRERLNERQG